jgi:Xaa-Pro aminopeptidase
VKPHAVSQRKFAGIAAGWAAIFFLFLTLPAAGREREANDVYASRRASLTTKLSAPVVLFGFTGNEESSPSYVFNQEENFYYLTGHNEEGAAILLLPAGATDKGWKGPRDILFLPSRDAEQERWHGPRMAPGDAGIAAKTGFAAVEDFKDLKSRVAALMNLYGDLYTLTPHSDDTGYPHARVWSAWLGEAAPQAKLQDAEPAIGAMRQIKSPAEIALLTKAIDLSIDAHLLAMRMTRPGLYEYQVAARMVEVHGWGGCEGEAYAPIVGTGFDSTVLHFNELSRQIRDEDVVLLDVGCQYAGYAADVTRTIPANGHFTARQKEIYEIVLGAQNAALAALKPGMTLGGRGSKSLYLVALNYMNAHGTDRGGRTLGRYFIHGLGHHIGLNVHDAGEVNRPLEPGMVITIEPGIYLPEENLGVRIEDDVLITETGYKLLTARLPRNVAEIEAIMAGARSQISGQEPATSGRP